MYLEFYGLREPPFTLQPDPGFLYLGKRHSMAYTLLEYGVLNRAPITVITGEIGAGKTTLLRHLLDNLEQESVTVGLISNTHRAFGNLLEWISLAYDLPFEERSEAALYRQFVDFLIREYAEGRRTVLIVDEAQNMDPATLEELRVISNVNADKDQVLQLILAGQPELRETLRRPELEQFAQRVSVDYHLSPLEPEETDAYIRHRLRVAGGDAELIEAAARRFIHHQAGGIPRLVNNLCETALVYGFAAQQKPVSAELVHEVVQDRIRNGGGLLTRRHKSAGVVPVGSGGEGREGGGQRKDRA